MGLKVTITMMQSEDCRFKTKSPAQGGAVKKLYYFEISASVSLAISSSSFVGTT